MYGLTSSGGWGKTFEEAKRPHRQVEYLIPHTIKRPLKEIFFKLMLIFLNKWVRLASLGPRRRIPLVLTDENDLASFKVCVF